MRGSERILFIGNMHCLTQDNNEYIWQLKRIVVTDSQIYYFQYTNFKGQQVIEDWITFQESNATLPQMQERTPYFKQNKLDPDSITAPPHLVQSVADRQVFLLPQEQLPQLFQRMGINPSMKHLHSLKVICLINKLSKEVQYMIPMHDQDSLLFYRAISVGNAFVKYSNFCQTYNQSPNQYLLTWFQECTTKIVPVLEIEFEKLLPSYKHIIENTNLVNGLNFKFSFQTHIKTFQQLHSSLKADQLIQLTLKKVEITSAMILDLNALLQNNIYLEELDLSQNLIDDKGIDFLSRLFEHCPDLKKLDVSNNKIQGDDLNFEIFLLKMGQILLNISLNLSSNLLNDSSIPTIENRLISDDQSNISFINLSFNKFTRQGIWRLFIGLSAAKQDRELQFKISPLPFSVQMIQQIAESERKPFIVSNRKTVSQHSFRKSFFEQKQYEQDTLNLTIQRKITGKMQVSTNAALEQIEKKKFWIENILKHGEPTVEVLYQISQEIQDFEYELPFGLQMNIQEIVWNKLNEATLIRDHYAISYLTFSAFNLNMDTSIFKEKYSKLAKRMQRLEQRINNLLNFQVEESKINQELDSVIQECYRLDLRGQPLDFLIALKLQSEGLIKQYIESDYDWQMDAQNDVLGDNKVYLNRDLQLLSIKIPQKLQIVDENLYKHPREFDHFYFSEIPLQTLQIYHEKILKLRSYLKTLDDKTYINTSTLEDFNYEEYKKMIKLIQIAYCRIEFLIKNHMIFIDQQNWNDNYEDLQLNSVRLIINYYSHPYRIQQIRTIFDELNPNYQEMTLHEIIEEIDNQHQYIDSNILQYRYYLSDIYLVNQQISLIEQVITFDSSTSINDYPFLGSSKTHILNIDHPVYEYVSQYMNNLLKVIFKEMITLKVDLHLDQTLLLRQIRNIIDICTNSPCSSLMGDELYLNIIVQQQKEFETQLITLFLLYVPPSRNMIGPLKYWLKDKIRALQLLQRWENDDPMPYWLPCEYELSNRLNSQIKIVVDDITIQIQEFDTVFRVMELIYEQMNQDDKYYYWLYLRVQYATNNKQIPLYKDIPLLGELGFFEAVSRLYLRFPSSKNSLQLCRRIHSAYISINGDNYQKNVKRYINSPYVHTLYSTTTIIQIAAILLSLELKSELQEKAIKIMKYTKLASANDLKEKILQDTQLTPQRILQHIPKHSNVLDPLQCLQHVKQFMPYPEEELQQLYNNIMKNNPTNYGNCYFLHLDEQKMLMVVCSACILYYCGQEFEFAILYQDIVGISISATQLRIHTIKTCIKQYIFTTPQALDIYQDILSYQQLRLKEPLDMIYSYNEYYKMKYFYNIHLCDDVDQNVAVQKYINLLQSKQLSNYHQINASNFANQNYLATFVQKQQSLLQEIQQIQPIIIEKPIFVFQKPCPLFQITRPTLIKSIDISYLFERNSKEEINQLFDPKISLFPHLVSNKNCDSLTSSIHQKTQRESLSQNLYLKIPQPQQGRRSFRLQMESRKQSLMSMVSNQIRTEGNTNRSEIPNIMESETKTDRDSESDHQQQQFNYNYDQQLQNNFNHEMEGIYQINEIEEEQNKSEFTSSFPSEIRDSQIRDSQKSPNKSKFGSKAESKFESKSSEQKIERRLSDFRRFSKRQSKILLESKPETKVQSKVEINYDYDESSYISFVKSQNEQIQNENEQQEIYESLVSEQYKSLVSEQQKSVTNKTVQSICMNNSNKNEIKQNDQNIQLGTAITTALAHFPKQQEKEIDSKKEILSENDQLDLYQSLVSEQYKSLVSEKSKSKSIIIQNDQLQQIQNQNAQLGIALGNAMAHFPGQNQKQNKVKEMNQNENVESDIYQSLVSEQYKSIVSEQYKSLISDQQKSIISDQQKWIINDQQQKNNNKNEKQQNIKLGAALANAMAHFPGLNK